MTTSGAKVGSVMRSALRIYLITAGIMFIGGAIGGGLLAMAGYALPSPF